MRGLILGQLFCLCRKLDSFSRGIWYATFKNYLSSSLHLFHLPVEVYIYSIYQSALHLFRLPVSFTFIPFPVWLTLFHLPVQFTFIPATPFPKFIYPSFNTWLMLILENHCVFSLWIGSTIVYTTP